jgi:hypothetical protein
LIKTFFFFFGTFLAFLFLLPRQKKDIEIKYPMFARIQSNDERSMLVRTRGEEEEEEAMFEKESSKAVVVRSMKKCLGWHRFGRVMAMCLGAVVLTSSQQVSINKERAQNVVASDLGAPDLSSSSSSSNSSNARAVNAGTNEEWTEKILITLHTGCSPMEKIEPFLENNFEENEYDWQKRIAAKIVLRDDDGESGEDFSFERGIPMVASACGTYEVETRALKTGTSFGFALYEISRSSDSENIASLGQFVHSNDKDEGVVIKDVGCLTTNENKVDKRCPWGTHAGVPGGFSSMKAEEGDTVAHPFGMRECTFAYEYGDVTFYNRVFDGRQTSFVWGSCLESCPAFTEHPYCAKSKDGSKTIEVPETTTTTTTSIDSSSSSSSDNAFTCEKGHYISVDTNGLKSCGECPSGSFSFLDDDKECELCPAGFFQPFPKGSKCEPCPRGMYQDGRGEKYCIPCDGSALSSDEREELENDEIANQELLKAFLGHSSRSSSSSSSSSKQQRSNNRKLLGGWNAEWSSLDKEWEWWTHEKDLNGDGVIDEHDIIEEDVEAAENDGRGASSKDMCPPKDDQFSSALTKKREVSQPNVQVPLTNKTTTDDSHLTIVSEEAKEARKENEPEATFAEEQSVPVISPDTESSIAATTVDEIEANVDPKTVASAITNSITDISAAASATTGDADETNDVTVPFISPESESAIATTTVNEIEAKSANERALEDKTIANKNTNNNKKNENASAEKAKDEHEEEKHITNVNDEKNHEIDEKTEIAGEAATLKQEVRQELKLHALLHEKDIDVDDTIVDKKIAKEKKIIETFDKVNDEEEKKIEKTLLESGEDEEDDHGVFALLMESSDDKPSTARTKTTATPTPPIIIATEKKPAVTSSSSSSSSSVVTPTQEHANVVVVNSPPKKEQAKKKINEQKVKKIIVHGCDESIRGEFGSQYRGCQTKTRTGKTCIDWSNQPFGSKSGEAHQKWSFKSYPDTMDENPKNYCRNPQKSSDGLWCYVSEDGKFDLCDPVGFAGGFDETTKDEDKIVFDDDAKKMFKKPDVFDIARIFSDDTEQQLGLGEIEASTFAIWPNAIRAEKAASRTKLRNSGDSAE